MPAEAATGGDLAAIIFSLLSGCGAGRLVFTGA
jgi:hypothetical protein